MSNHLEDLQLTDAFNVQLRCPQLEEPSEIEAALRHLVADATQRSAIASAITKPLGIKQLLMVLETARGASWRRRARLRRLSATRFLGDAQHRPVSVIHQLRRFRERATSRP